MPLADFPFHILKTPGTLTAATVGLSFGVTLDGDSLVSTDDAVGSWLEHKTLAVSGMSAGMLTGFDVLAAGWQPQLELELRTPTDVASLRYWVGLFSTKPDGLVLPGTGHHFAAMRYDPGAGDSTWTAVVHNGSGTPSTLAVGPTVAGGTVYTLAISISASETLFGVNGTPVSAVPKVPSPGVLLGLGIRVTAQVDTAKTLEWRRASWLFG